MKILYLLLIGVFMSTVSCQSQQSGSLLPVETFSEKLKAEPAAVLLDVRTPGEFSEGYISNAVNIDFNSESFKNKIANLDKSKTYYVYCLAGGRSASAADYMRNNGFAKVYDLKGGIMAWKRNKLPLANAAEGAADKFTMEQFQQLASSDSIVLIDFYAPWCAPCKQMEPMLTELTATYKGKVKIVRFNIDENKKLAGTLQVEEIPVFKMYRNGKETWMHKGIISREDLVAILDKL